jgi:hypothetical protein
MSSITTLPSGPTPLEVRDLLAAWGWITGPDLRDSGSRFRRGRLAGRGLPTFTRARRARRRSDPIVRLSDWPAPPRHLAGAPFVWSANSPPAVLGA